MQQMTADLLARIRADVAQMTPKQRGIADFLLNDPESFIRRTSRDICARLNTSEPTLIRFCKDYGYSGLSEFRIDLALALAHDAQMRQFVEPAAQDRRNVNLDAKRCIARAAVPLVAGDQAILIDNGSTAELFAAALDQAQPMTIMTTGLMVAQNLLAHGHHEVILTGGRIRPNALSLTGRLVERSLQGMRFDTFVMGADSVDPVAGLSTFREDEAHQTRAMVAAAARVIVLADRTKFLKPSLHKICDLDRVNILVTDLPGDQSPARDLASCGVHVISTCPPKTPQ